MIHRRPHHQHEAGAGAGVPVITTDAPPPPAWLRRPVLGRQSDRDLPSHLERELRGMGAVLHDMRLPATTHTIDHLVVAPSGIWLIDTVHITGRISRRDVGSRQIPERRLLLNGADQTDLVDTLGVLRAARDAISNLEFDVEVHTALCLIDATWPMSARPFQVRHHWVTWPRALTDKIRSSGLVPIRTAHDIAQSIRAIHSAGVHPVGGPVPTM